MLSGGTMQMPTMTTELFRHTGPNTAIVEQLRETHPSRQPSGIWVFPRRWRWSALLIEVAAKDSIPTLQVNTAHRLNVQGGYTRSFIIRAQTHSDPLQDYVRGIDARGFQREGRVFAMHQGKPDTHPTVVQQFASGFRGEQPSPSVIEAAVQLFTTGSAETDAPEFTVDVDGALSIDLRLNNGLRMLAELTIDGSLDAGFYDDRSDDGRVQEVKYLPQTTAEELIAYITQSLCQFHQTT